MFKDKNEVTKISNIFLIVIGLMSILSILTLLSSGVDGIEGYSENDYYFNLIMMIVYTLLSGIILFITNKKLTIYKDEYPLSRRVFNLFIVISVMSALITLSANILSYFFYDNFSWHSLVVLIIGYIPAYIIANKEVSKGELLSNNNEQKINVANLLITYLLMNYYVNVITILSQMIFKLNEITTLIGALCWSFIWIIVIIISYRLINKKEEITFKRNKKK